jgi:DNA transformation protein
VDANDVIELFAGFGPVTVRRMFGGAGIYADGTIFGLVADGVIYLKADQHTIPDFEREGLKPFTYEGKRGKLVALRYWRMPDRLYDDPDELARWAQAALTAARRVPPKPRRGRGQSNRGTSERPS